MMENSKGLESIKNVLHLTHTDILSDSRILKEMVALGNAGYVVSGVGCGLTPDGAQRSSVPKNIDINTVKLRSRSWTFLPTRIRHGASLFELIAKMLPIAIRKKSDVIHCHDTLVLPLGVVAKFLTGAKLIYDAHELESDRNGLTRRQGWLILRVEKLLWRYIDGLIVVSPSIEIWYRERIGKKLSVVILNAPLFTELSYVNSNYLRKKFAIPSDRKIFIYVGIFGAGRGVDLITQAFAHPDITSHIVFLGYGSLEEKLKRLSEVNQNIHVHDAVPHAEVVSIVQSADFGLCLVENASLSDYYCLPNKLFEYCFAGVPVLASDFPEINRVVSENGIGICSNLTLPEIMKSIRKLESSNMIFEFSTLKSLSWQEQERKLEGLYQDILG